MCVIETLLYSVLDIACSLSAGSLTGVTASEECLLLTISFLVLAQMRLLSAVNMPGIFLPPSLFLGNSHSLHQHAETHILQLCLNSFVLSPYQALTVRGP